MFVEPTKLNQVLGPVSAVLHPVQYVFSRISTSAGVGCMCTCCVAALDRRRCRGCCSSLSLCAAHGEYFSIGKRSPSETGVSGPERASVCMYRIEVARKAMPDEAWRRSLTENASRIFQ